MINAIKANGRWGQKTAGTVPALIERYVEEYKNPQVDWRTILDEFVQDEMEDNLPVSIASLLMDTLHIRQLKSPWISPFFGS